MDAEFENPSIEPPVQKPEDPEDDQASSDEGEGLDWTKALPAHARPVIPKRGEKQFEPSLGVGTESGLQQEVLNRARNAMFATLRTPRTISSKSVSQAIWYPSLERAYVRVARGIHFTTIGHSASRPVPGPDGVIKYQKKLELLPEETIYLVERGTLFCWKDTSVDVRYPLGIDGMEQVAGEPMSVQQVYSEMIDKEGLNQDKFQVYAYLKRLGYAVTRTNPPTSDYIPAASYPKLSSENNNASQPTASRTLLGQMLHLLKDGLLHLTSVFRPLFRFLRWNCDIDWWKPLRFRFWRPRDWTYGHVFRSLRFIPSGHRVPLRAERNPDSPYTPFWNVYKPSTPFKKTAPPPPDFQIVVVNARTTKMPTLPELTALFDAAPILPPPQPRRRRQPVPANANAEIGSQAAKTSSEPHVPPVSTSSHDVALNVKESRKESTTVTANPKPQPQFPFKVNPFAALRNGRKMVVVAMVDAGNLSFFRFSQGVFEEWPMAG